MNAFTYAAESARIAKLATQKALKPLISEYRHNCDAYYALSNSYRRVSNITELASDNFYFELFLEAKARFTEIGGDLTKLAGFTRIDEVLVTYEMSLTDALLCQQFLKETNEQATN